MENATKTLLIVGSVLITLLVITAGVYIFDKGKIVPRAKKMRDEQDVVDSFNSKFARLSK